MASVSTSTASGQGTLALGAQRTVVEVAIRVITPATYATFAGVAGRKRYHQVGWIGLGFTPGSGPFSGIILMSWQAYIANETWTYRLGAGLFATPDTLYYDLKAGAVMYLEVDW